MMSSESDQKNAERQQLDDEMLTLQAHSQRKGYPF